MKSSPIKPDRNHMSELNDPIKLPSLAGRELNWAMYATIALCDIELAVQALRSTILACLLGPPVGASNTEERIWAYLLHDIGQLEVPTELLRTPGPLDDGQRQALGTHTLSGARMISKLPNSQEATEIVLRHHERWDGTGYPSGLTDVAIPVGARVLSVADVYSALTAPRPQRNAYPAPDAMQMVKDLSGSQFDPDVVEAMSEVALHPGIVPSAGEGNRSGILGPRLWTHVERGATLSAAQREALFAAAFGLEASDAAARLGRAAGTQRTWSSSLRRSLAVPPRQPVPVFLTGLGRDVFSALMPARSSGR